jgi:hypothetical protein
MPITFSQMLPMQEWAEVYQYSIDRFLPPLKREIQSRPALIAIQPIPMDACVLNLRVAAITSPCVSLPGIAAASRLRRKRVIVACTPDGEQAQRAQQRGASASQKLAEPDFHHIQSKELIY